MNHLDNHGLGYLGIIDTTKSYYATPLPPELKELGEYPELRRFARLRVYWFVFQWNVRSAISTLLYRLSRWIDP